MTIDAFELIAPQLRSIALSKAVAMGLDYDEQQDIAQETLLRLWQIAQSLATQTATSVRIWRVGKQVRSLAIRRNHSARRRAMA